MQTDRMVTDFYSSTYSRGSNVAYQTPNESLTEYMYNVVEILNLLKELRMGIFASWGPHCSEIESIYLFRVQEMLLTHDE